MEKSELKRLVEQHAQTDIDDLKAKVESLETLRDGEEKKKRAKELRNRFAQAILTKLIPIEPVVAQVNNSADVDKRKELFKLLVDILIDEVPELGVLAPIILQNLASVGTGTDTDADKTGAQTDDSSGQATGSGEKGEAPEEELTDSEIASLPDSIKNEVNKFISMSKLLEEIAKIPASNQSLLEAYLDELKEQLQLLQLKDLNKVLIPSSLPIDQKEKIINFAKAILKRAQDALNPPTTVAMITTASSTVDKVYPPLKFEGSTDEVGFANKLDEAFRLRYEDDPEEAYNFLIRSANQAVSNYFASGSGLSSGSFKQLLGTYWILAEFGKDVRDHKRIDAQFHTQYQLDKITDETKRAEYLKRLKSKSLEILMMSYIEHTTRKFGNIVSMTSDWEKVANFSKEEQDHFTPKNYDIMMQPEVEGSYEYADLMRWAMWKLPGWIISYGNKYQDKIGDTRSKFNEFIKKEYFEAVINSGNGFTEIINEKEITVSKETIVKLKSSFESKDNPDYTNFVRYFESISTSLGVRLHTFRNDLARGATPAGGVGDQRRFMAAVCPYALNNYNCYKGLSPHLSAEGFEVVLGEPVKDIKEDGVKVGIEIEEKIFNINLSIAKTQELLQSVQHASRNKIELGDLTPEIIQNGKKIPNPDYGIENIYPDLYTFIVRDYEDRSAAGKESKNEKKSAADLISWWAGLTAIESFVELAVAPPLGTFDRKSISAMEPEEARGKMREVLQQLVQKIVSPLKANQSWVRWDHVAQYLLMYVDKMFRTYRLIDDTEGGTAILAREIREDIFHGMANLGGVGGVGPEGDVNIKKLIIPGEEKQFASPTNARLSVGQMLLGTPAEQAGLSPQTLLEFERQGKLKKEYDLRDYILNRIPKATGYSFHPSMMRLNYATVEERKGASIARARATTGSRIDSLIVSPVSSLRIERSKFFDKSKVEKFYKSCEQVLFGTPTADQKKTADEKK